MVVRFVVRLTGWINLLLFHKSNICFNQLTNEIWYRYIGDLKIIYDLKMKTYYYTTFKEYITAINKNS